MKRPLLVIAMLASVFATQAQSVLLPNGDFENWTTTNYDEPLPWYTSNEYTVPEYGIISVSQVTGSNGNAARLETKAAGPDPLVAFISNTEGDPEAGDGGVPFTQQSTSFRGMYRSNIVSGDTAFILVVFKKNGTILSQNYYNFTGSHSGFSSFNFPVAPMAQAPDTVVIAAVSGNVFNGTPQVGSWLELDELSFDDGVTNITAPNGDFENWQASSYDKADDWFQGGFGRVEKTTDKYTGSLAAKLISQDDGSGYIEEASLLLGTSGQLPGTPFTKLADTLTGYYKYVTSGADNALVYVQPTDPNGMSTGPGIYHPLTPVANYTYFEIPISSGTTPSNLAIELMSSDYTGNPVDGSTLYVDNLRLKNTPDGIGRIEHSKDAFRVYPNPAKSTVYIQRAANITGPVDVRIYDVTGKVLYTDTYNGQSLIKLSLQNYAPGLYHYEVANETTATRGKFVKE